MEIGQFQYLKWFPFEKGDKNIVDHVCIGASEDVMPPTWSRLLSNLTHTSNWEPPLAVAIFDAIKKFAAKRPVISGMGKVDVEPGFARVVAETDAQRVRRALPERKLLGGLRGIVHVSKTSEASRRLRRR